MACACPLRQARRGRCTDAGQVMADISLNELERRLDPASFRRVHGRTS
jgi:hypothetical protein